MIRRIIEWIFGKPGMCRVCDEPADSGDHTECDWFKANGV